MRKIILSVLLVCNLQTSLSEAAVNSKEQNFTQDLTAGTLAATTTFAITDAGFLSVVSLRFSAAPASAETIQVFRDSRAGTNFDSLLATYVTVAGSTTHVSFIFGNVIPIAETDQVRITCTNVSVGDPTVSVSVMLDLAARNGAGINIYDNGLLKISGLQHDYRWHFGDVIPDANQSFGAFYSDYVQIAVPTNPAASTRRLFVDSNTGEMSVRTSAGVTVSLEVGAAAATTSFSTIDTSSGTDPVADSAADTLTVTGSGPVTVTGNSATDVVVLAISQNAGTDITADLEEETHATEHDIGAGDEVPFYGTVQDEGIALTRRRIVNMTGTGVACVDNVGSVSTDCTVSGGAGGGDNITVNGVSAADADFDDATPAAPGDGVNVRWQKDALAPNNVSGNLQFATGTLPGAVSAAAQTFAGSKTFADNVNIDNQRTLMLSELDANGANLKGFQAPAAVTADTVCVLEDDANFIPDSCVGNGTDDGGAGPNAVTVAVDFGASGSDFATTTVTGATWVTASSVISCAPTMTATASRSDGAEDGVAESLTVSVWDRNDAADTFKVSVSPVYGRAIGIYNIHCIGSGADFSSTVEADPTLTNDGAVTIGNGVVDPTVLTFNSDAGVDGTQSYAGTTDTFTVGPNVLVTGTLSAQATGVPSVRLGQKISTDTVAAAGGAAFTVWSAVADSDRPLLDFNRSRSSTQGTHTLVLNGDSLGQITSRASDGTAFQNASSIRTMIDGAPGAGDMPGRLEFLTTPDASTVLMLRMGIRQDGRVQIGTSTSDSDSKLEVAGHVTIEGTAPTVSACGTTPTIVGNDVAGKVTTGSGVITACTLTFALAWTNDPACTVNNETAIQLIRGVSTPTTLVIDSAIAITSSVISYICIGRG